ncbi:hypothetical protein GPECTOR_91g556 [Gonium pectorale]|uniref:Uncharacterized protein n=1 Tax=Gonium pectorale TaxID=33097 RepID=A0A150G0M3_GONPE|nr:hypothetical protein GPECTOR_91g556 [Gonium pectorale]|eukprot:KXZ43402.1 hypothetical protein GPECTOR_91g556 [Gonium pectorale]
MVASFKSLSQSARGAWLQMWSTHTWTLLRRLQESRQHRPLHLYMNGDSTFRQQKNFLCSILQPGYMRGHWALDNSALHEEREASCYNASLALRVTFVDNPCCDARRLAYLAEHSAPPGGSGGGGGAAAASGGGGRGGGGGAGVGMPPAWRSDPRQRQQGGQRRLYARRSGGAAAADPGGRLQWRRALRKGSGPINSSDSLGSSSGGGREAMDSSGDGGGELDLVLYLNCGLHLLHLGSARRFECLPQQYKYIDTVTNFSDAAGQVFMTTNYICEGNFIGEYGRAAAALAADPEPTVAACMTMSNSSAVAGAFAGDAEALAYACRHGLFTGAATRRLWHRMTLAVAELMRRGGGEGGREGREPSGRRRRQQSGDGDGDGGGHGDGEGGERRRRRSIAVVDAFSLTAEQCWASEAGDGRHYPLLVPLVVTELIGAVRQALGG